MKAVTEKKLSEAESPPGGSDDKDSVRQKPIEQLRDQLKLVSSEIGTSITPPGVDQKTVTREELSDMRTSNLLRAEALKDILNTLRGADGGTLDVDEAVARLGNQAKFVIALNNITTYLEKMDANQEEDAFHLRPHQREVFEALTKFLEKGSELGWVKLPTGYGKTAMFVALAQACGLKTLVLEPTIDLVRQTKKSFTKFAPDLEVSCFYTHQKEIGGNVTVSSYQSLNRLIKQSRKGDYRFDLVICDEAHRSLSENRLNLLDKIPGSRFTIGFTATTHFSEDKNVPKHFGEKIAELDVGDAIEDDILCGVKCGVLETDCDISQVPLAKNGDFDKKKLQQAVDIKKRNDAVVKIMSQPQNSEKSAAAFCLSVAHAKLLSKELNKNGIKAACVWGGMPDKQRKMIIEQHKEGKIQVICSKNVIIEGWDSPRTEIAFMLQPTLSPIIAEQRLGRVLRHFLSDENGYIKPFARVWEIIDRGAGGGTSEPEATDNDADQGARGITAMDILGAAEVMPKKASQSSGGGGGGDPEELPVIEGIKVIVDPKEVMEVNAKVSVLERLPFRVHKGHIRKFLKETACLPADKAFDCKISITADGKPYSVSAKKLADTYVRYSKSLSEVSKDEDGLLSLAQNCFESGPEREAYLSLRCDVDSLEKLAEDSSGSAALEQLLREKLVSFTKIPDLDSFDSLLFELPGMKTEAEHICGRTVAGYLGIENNQQYRSLLIKLFPVLPQDELPQTAGERGHTFSSFNVEVVRDLISRKISKPKNARIFLTELAYPHPVTLVREIDASGVKNSNWMVNVREYLEAYRRHLNVPLSVDGDLLDQMIVPLAGYAVGERDLQHDIEKTYMRRKAVVDAIERGDLPGLMWNVPRIHYMTPNQFSRIMFYTLGFMDLDGDFFLDYAHAVKGAADEGQALNGLLEEAFGADRLAERRRLIIEEVVQMIRDSGPEQFSASDFHQRKFNLSSGDAITGAQLLFLLDYSESKQQTAKQFLEDLFGAELQSCTYWLDNSVEIKKLWERSKRAIKNGSSRDQSFDSKLVPPYNQLELGEEATFKDLLVRWAEYHSPDLKADDLNSIDSEFRASFKNSNCWLNQSDQLRQVVDRSFPTAANEQPEKWLSIRLEPPYNTDSLGANAEIGDLVIEWAHYHLGIIHENCAADLLPETVDEFLQFTYPEKNWLNQPDQLRPLMERTLAAARQDPTRNKGIRTMLEQPYDTKKLGENAAIGDLIIKWAEYHQLATVSGGIAGLQRETVDDFLRFIKLKK